MEKTKTYWIVGVIVVILVISLYMMFRVVDKTNPRLPVINSEYSALQNSEYLNAQKVEAVGVEDMAKEIEKLSEGKLTYKFNRNSTALESLTCTSTNKKPVIKEFSSYSPEQPMVGGWLEIKIVDCGDYYFISEASDANWILYGMFQK